MLRQCLQALAECVYRYGGRVDRFLGDGLLAAFGLPEAHEDDPERAIRAALDMQQSVAYLRNEFRSSSDWEMHLRVGIDTGAVIAGQVAGGDGPDTSIYGHAVNVTSRLQEAARPDTVLVTEAVFRLTYAKFEFAKPTSLQLRGVPQPVLAYQVLGLQLKPGHSRGLAGRHAPMVGRQTEAGHLMHGLNRLLTVQRGFVAAVSGPAGVGKSRLVEEGLSAVKPSATVVRAEANPHSMTGFGLLAQLLENYFEGEPAQDVADGNEQLQQDKRGTSNQDIDPALLDLIGIGRSSAGSSDAVGTESVQARQQTLVNSVRRQFATHARQQPIVLVCEDVHWADRSSLEVIVGLLDLVDELPLAILITTRAEFQQEFLDLITSRKPGAGDWLIEIALKELTTEQCSELIDHLLDRAGLPPGLERAIADRSGGNPFLLEEILRMLLDRGVIRRDSDIWEVRPGWETDVQQVPETVAGLVLGRFDRLSANLRLLLQAASVLGRTFNCESLSAVSGQELDVTSQHLATLQALDFVRSVSVVRPDEYSFRHALSQQAIYDTLLQGSRSELHLRAARYLEQQGDARTEEDTVLIAHHYVQSAPEQAVPYLLQAARKAQARLATNEAIAFFRRAEAILNGRADGEGLTADDGVILGDLLAQIGESAQAEARYRVVLEQRSQLRDYIGIGRVRMKLARLANHRDEPSVALEHLDAAELALAELGTAEKPGYTRSDLARERGWAYLSMGDLHQARSFTQTAIEIAEAHGDDSALAQALNLIAGVMYRQGRLHEAVVQAERAAQLHEQLGDALEAARLQANMAVLYIELGEWQRAEQMLRQALFVQEEVSDQARVTNTCNSLGLLMMNQGRFQDALHHFNRALRLATPLGDQISLVMYRINRGHLWLRTAKPHQAVADLEVTLQQIREYDVPPYFRDEAKALLAETYLHINRLSDAEALVQECLAAIAPDETGDTVALAHRAAAAVDRAAGRTASALHHLEQAEQLYRQSGNRFELARVQQRLGELLCETPDEDGSGHLERGLTCLTDALLTFRQLGARKDARDVDEILRRLPGARRARAAAPPSTATRLATVVCAAVGAAAEDGADHPLLAQLELAMRQISDDTRGDLVHTRHGLALVYDSAQDALAPLRAALAVRDSSLHLNRARSSDAPSLDVRVGIAVGRVPEGPDGLIEEELAANVAPVGRQAAGLAEQAAPGEALATLEVHQLGAEQFGFEPAGGDAFRLLGARTASDPTRRVPGSAAQTIGREREIAALRQFAERLTARTPGGVCYLEGEAGTGKTRMLEELQSEWSQSFTLLHGKCETYRAGMTYWPFLDMLATASGQALDPAGELRTLLGAHTGGRSPLGGLPPEQARNELFTRFRNALGRAAAQGPVLLIIEDVHWVDLASLDLLEFLIPLTVQEPVGLLLVGRAELAGSHRALIGHAERACHERFMRVALADLSPDDSAALACALLAVDALPAPLQWLRRRRGNNPLLIEETCRLMVERGWLQPREPGAEAPGTGPLVPETIQEVMLSRLDSLKPDAQHAVHVAAVIGETFDKSVLRRVAGLEDLDQRLVELVERGIVLPADPSNPLAFRFKHTLTRETVYSTILTSKRTLLHQRAAEAIESLFADRHERLAEVLAYHYENSGVADKAIDYLVLAGQQAAERFARDDALSYFHRAQQLLQRSGAAAIRPRFAAAVGTADAVASFGRHREANEQLQVLLGTDVAPRLSPAQRASLHRRLGRSLRGMGDLESAIDAYGRARSLITGSAELEPVGTAVDLSAEQVQERVACEFGLAQAYFEARDFNRARLHAQWSLAVAQRTGQPAAAADAQGLLGAVAYARNDLPAASEAVHASLSIRQQLGDRWGAAAAYSNLGVLAYTALDWTAAENYMRNSLDLRLAVGDTVGVVIAKNNLGQLLKDLGRTADAVPVLESACQTGRQVDARPQLAQAWINLAEALALSGNTERARAAFDRSQQLVEMLGPTPLQAELLWKRAEWLAGEGQNDAAVSVAEQAVQAAQQVSAGPVEAEARRVLALAESQRGNAEAALAHVQAYSEWLAHQTDPFLRARFDLERGLCQLQAGDLRGAEQSLSGAEPVFSQAGAQRYLPRLLSGLDQVRQIRASLTRALR